MPDANHCTARLQSEIPKKETILNAIKDAIEANWPHIARIEMAASDIFDHLEMIDAFHPSISEKSQHV